MGSARMERATHQQSTVPLRRLPAAKARSTGTSDYATSKGNPAATSRRKGPLNPPHGTHQGAETVTGNQSSKASATSA